MKTKTILMIQLLLIIAGFSLTAVSCSNLFGNDNAKKSSYLWTVTFDGQGATTEATPTTKTVKKPARTIDALPVSPTKTGYTFAGWWTAINGGGTEFIASTKVTKKITVYAKWSENPVYTVTFNSDGGSAVGEQYVTLPATTVGTLPAAPTKAGYTFAGWWTAINGGGTEFTASTPVTASLTVWAKWSVDTVYTVTFNTDGGSAGSVQYVTLPATTVGTLPAVPTKATHTFAGWWTAINGGGNEFTEISEVTANITVYAKWTIIASPPAWFTTSSSTFTGLSTEWTDSTDPDKYNLAIPSTVTNISSTALQGNTSITSVVIPSSITSIADNTFRNCIGLTSVTIPSSVTNIGGSAFDHCTGLISVSIPSSVTSIGDNAFYGCTGLTSISIPSSVTSIGYAAFSNCTGLTSISFPSTVTSIGYYAFSGCTGLTSVSIPTSITSIGTAAFHGCTGLTSISIPSSVTSIGISAFRLCTGLTSISIPSSVTSIGNSAFDNCTGLTSISIPSSVTSIGGGSFSFCTGLTSISIPSSVTSIGDQAFYFCTGLTSISIPSSVTSIGWTVFYGCAALTSISIPSSVTSIGIQAFRDCTLLNTVILNCTNIPTVSSDSFSNNASGRKFKVPSGMIGGYQTTGVWQTTYLSAIESQ